LIDRLLLVCTVKRKLVKQNRSVSDSKYG